MLAIAKLYFMDCCRPVYVNVLFLLVWADADPYHSVPCNTRCTVHQRLGDVGMSFLGDDWSQLTVVFWSLTPTARLKVALLIYANHFTAGRSQTWS